MRRHPAFGITLYRDDPDAGEANVESRFVGTEPTVEVAIAEARKAAMATGWPCWSATVDTGENISERTRDGIWLTHFEDAEHGVRWYLGPDWLDQETL